MLETLQEIARERGYRSCVVNCPIHGERSTLRLEGVEPVCPVCDIERDDERRRSEERNARETVANQSIPRRYWGRGFDEWSASTPEERRALETCRAYTGGGNLLLVGSVGTGKTHLACAILQERGGVYAHMPSVIDEITAGFSCGRSKLSVIEPLQSEWLLVLDEVGRRGAYEREVIYDIIDSRYCAGLGTILISNLSVEMLSKCLRPSIFDRIKSQVQIVELWGASHR